MSTECTFMAFCHIPEKCLLADRCMGGEAEIAQNLRRVRMEEGRNTEEEAADWINYAVNEVLLDMLSK